MLPGEIGGAGVQEVQETGVQAEGAGVQQCGEGVVWAGASWKGSLLDKRAAEYSTGKTMSLLIGPDILSIRMGSVLADRAGYYITWDGQCPC